MRGLCLLPLLLAPLVASAVDGKPPADGAQVALASGKPDGKVPGWSIRTALPQGWTQDCCLYARAIGVDLVLYKGEWTGKPERVMVLNAWPAKLAALDDELREDRRHYLRLDPAAKVEDFPVENAALACKGVFYRGTDKEDDAVVFCDPGKAAGIRFSWSMTLAAGDAAREDALAQFRRVVDASRYTKYVDGAGKTPR